MTIKAIIEMPAGTKYKYEIDKESGIMAIDRVNPIAVPFNYGFIPETLEDDGDALDIFIVSNDPIPPFTKVKVVILGGYRCTDNGFADNKIVGYLEGEVFPSTHWVAQQVETYLKNYKPSFNIDKQLTYEEAEELLETSVRVFQR